MASQADEERTSLMLLGTKQEQDIANLKKENTALKKGASPIGAYAEAGVELVTAGAIGAFEGYKSAGDPAKAAGLANVAPIVGIVGGMVTALASGPGMARTAGINVAKASATIFVYNMASKEAAAVAVQGLKVAAQNAAKAATAAIPGAPPVPGVQGINPLPYRART